ncbi:hypothetical protein [Paenibacillus agilis]|nr:hypothetical protein [Paenibacillus agilis]
MYVFNIEKKSIYLEQFENQDTKEVYTRLFRKSFETEESMQKDLYNFDDSEFENFFLNTLKPKTKESARTYCNVLSAYVQWAIDNKYSNHLINPIKRRQAYFYEFVQNDNKMYISLEEKDAIISTLINKQDSFIVEALWNGIEGSQVHEITNMRIDDLNLTENTITIRNNEGAKKRVVKVDKESNLIELAILANREQVYYKMNGTVDYSDNLKEYVELSSSKYILKGAKLNQENGGEKVSRYTVYNRLEKIRMLEDNEEYTKALTSKYIMRSGMIYMALRLYERDGELGRNQIEKICAKYNMKYKWSLRDFLNVDILSELYPSEMKRIQAKIATEE